MTDILERFGLTGSMKPKLIALFLLISIIPIITVSYLAFEYGSASTEEQVMAHLTSIADIKKDVIERWFEKNQNDVKIYSGYIQVVNLIDSHEKGTADLPEIKRDVTNLFQNINYGRHHYKRLAITNNSGAVIVSTDTEDIGSILNDNYITYPISTKEVYIKDIFKTDEDEFSMIFSAPIFSVDNETGEKSNEVIGILIIEIDMAESLYPIIGNLHGMGDSGETLLVRREGNEVVFINELRHMNESALYLRIPINSTDALPAIRSSGGEEGIMITDDYRGEQVLSAYRHIDFPNWGLVAKIDQKEAFAGINNLRNQIAAVSVFLILLAFVMAILVSTRITRPIIHLEELTKKVAQGDFSEYPKVTSNDEIGSLTNSFVKMETDLARSRRELEDYSENLEHKVEQRTKELEESEGRFRGLFETMSSGVAVYEAVDNGKDFIFKDFNPAGERIEGLRKEDIIGKRVTKVFPGVEDFGIFEVFQRVWRTGKSEDFPQAIYMDDKNLGSWRENQVYNLPSGEIVAVYDDITERKKAEEELQETSDYLNKLIDYTNAPFVVWDPELKITKVNHAFERLTGYSADELVNTKLPMYFPKESRQQSMDQVERTLSGEYWESVDMPILQKSGNIRYMVWNSANLYDKDGKTIAITIAQGIDITERKKMADEIKEMNIDLEQKVEERTSELTAVNKELEAFSYSVSHDLRAPLRSVDGFSQALLEDYGDKFDETGTDYLNRVRNATLNMEHLIDDLLNLSRITRGEVVYKDVYLSELVSKIAERYEIEQPDRRVEFTITEGLKVNGDKRLLRAMLENLISNAYKFSSQEPIAKIEFGIANINDENIYYIRDNGVGFDMKYADKLFGAFQRLHSKMEFSGTGIGLATVQRIIHKHGGHVWAESELGKGATFYFTL